MAFLKSNLAKDVFYLGYTSYPFLGSYPKEIIWLENELKITLHIFFPFDSFYLFYLFIFLLYKIVLVFTTCTPMADSYQCVVDFSLGKLSTNIYPPSPGYLVIIILTLVRINVNKIIYKCAFSWSFLAPPDSKFGPFLLLLFLTATSILGLPW